MSADWGQLIATVITASGIGGALSLAVKGWFGRKKLDAEAGVTEADAAERIQRVSASIAENAQHQIEAARAWAAQEVQGARLDVERARRDADEARAAANQAWQAVLAAQQEMMAMATQWRRVVTEVRSPARTWERLEGLVNDGGPGGLNGSVPAGIPRF